MADETKEYRPRIIRGRTELWVPHNDGEIAFASPSHGLNIYRNVGSQILESGQRVPTGDYTASLLHASYCSGAREEPEFTKVGEIMQKKRLWIYNRNFGTDKGVYVIQDEDAVGRSKPLKIIDLESMLKGGKELSWGGIRFSQDEKVGFAPNGSYHFGEHTSKSLAKDGFIVISCKKKGAEKLGEVAAAFEDRPCVCGFEIQDGQTPKLRVSAVDVYYGLRFRGDISGDSDYGHAFGVLDKSTEGTSKFS